MDTTQEQKMVVIFRALINGLPCKIGNYTYRMDRECRVCTVAWNETDNEEVLLIFADEIRAIDYLARQAAEDEVFSIAANYALNEKALTS